MFQGSTVALVTPMDEHNAVDETTLRGPLDHPFEAGTTGESPARSRREFPDMLDDPVG